MSLGRKPGDPEVRDIEGDYIKAYLEEHANYIRAGLQGRANAVAVTLRQLGHEIDKAPSGEKERAVASTSLEQAVESPKRRGRPAKSAE
jgi:hypothetical protein